MLLGPIKCYLLDLVLDCQRDPAEAGPVVGAGGALVHVSVQNSLHLLCVTTQVQHAHHKVLALHGQLPVVVLHRRQDGKEWEGWWWRGRRQEGEGGREEGREGLIRGITQRNN